jgi:hypothetical protein
MSKQNIGAKFHVFPTIYKRGKMYKKSWLILLIVLVVGAISAVQVFAQQPIGENILALGPGISEATRDRVLIILDDEYPQQVRQWTQKAQDAELLTETDFLYIAYPNPGNDQNRRVHDLLIRELTVNARAVASTNNMFLSTTVCLTLNDYNWWLGDQFTTCHTQGTSYYMTLGSMNNRANSYYESHTSGAVKLYDNINFSGTLGTYSSDTASFGSSVNNKASSIRAWY